MISKIDMIQMNVLSALTSIHLHDLQDRAFLMIRGTLLAQTQRKERLATNRSGRDPTLS